MADNSKTDVFTSLPGGHQCLRKDKAGGMVRKGRKPKAEIKVRVSKVGVSEVARAGMSRTVRPFIPFERHVLCVLYRKEQGLI